MGPCKTHQSRIFVWIAAISILISMLAVGSAYARNIDWASTEYLYVPTGSVSFTSDCLIAGGQRILLADWQPSDTQREVLINIGRPVPEIDVTESSDNPLTSPIETMLPTQTVSTEPTQESGEQTEPVDPTESTEPAEPTDPTEPDLWPDDEAVIVLDQNAELFFICDAEVDENQIRLTMTRNQTTTPESAIPVSVSVTWNGLEATFIMNVLPEITGIDQPSEPDREIVTGLDLMNVFDTIRPEEPVTCLKLNLQTLSDFSVTFLQGDLSLRKVRFSIDGGRTYTMLYDSNVLTLKYPYPEGWDGTVFLDFGLCLEADSRPTISVSATGYLLEEYKPLPQRLPAPEDHLVKISGMPAVLFMEPKWGAASAQILDIERLVTDNNGQLGYQRDTSIVATMEREGLVFEPAKENTVLQPGSYRLTIHWIWNGIVIEDQIVYFFVNTN